MEPSSRPQFDPAGAGAVLLGTTAAGVTQFDAVGLAGGTTYVFRVRATGDGGNSEYSNNAYATTARTPRYCGTRAACSREEPWP